MALIAGGDTRMELNPATGFNKYGCAPTVRDVWPFGSCTSSNISSVGMSAAGRTFARLRAHVPASSVFVGYGHKLSVALVGDDVDGEAPEVVRRCATEGAALEGGGALCGQVAGGAGREAEGQRGEDGRGDG